MPLTKAAAERLRSSAMLAEVARINHEHSTPCWLRHQPVALTLVVAVTLVGLVGLLKDAGEVAVEIDASVEQIRAVLASDSADAEVLLGLHGFSCRRVEVVGARAPGRAAPGAPTGVIVFEAPAAPAATVRIRQLSIPRGAGFVFEAVGDVLTIRLIATTPDGEGPPLDYWFQIDVPAGARAEVRHDGDATEFGMRESPIGPRSATIRGSLRESDLELRLSLDLAATDEVAPLGLQGVDLAHLQFGDYESPGDSRPHSYLLGGELRFPGYDLEPIPLRVGEILSLAGRQTAAPRGQILEARYINSRSEAAMSPLPAQRLHILWSGTTHAIDVGRESRRNSRMPKAIFVWLGSRQQLYLIGVVTYAAIFAYSLITRTRPGVSDAIQPSELIS